MREPDSSEPLHGGAEERKEGVEPLSESEEETFHVPEPDHAQLSQDDAGPASGADRDASAGGHSRAASIASSIISLDASECPLCLDVFCDPVKSLCGHVFCRLCIGQALDACADVTARPCPLCRTSLPESEWPVFDPRKVPVEATIARRVRRRFPDEVAEREAAAALARVAAEQHAKSSPAPADSIPRHMRRSERMYVRGRRGTAAAAPEAAAEAGAEPLAPVELRLIIGTERIGRHASKAWRVFVRCGDPRGLRCIERVEFKTRRVCDGSGTVYTKSRAPFSFSLRANEPATQVRVCITYTAGARVDDLQRTERVALIHLAGAGEVMAPIEYGRQLVLRGDFAPEDRARPPGVPSALAARSRQRSLRMERARQERYGRQ